MVTDRCCCRSAADRQQAACLPHLASGAWTGTTNLTEPQARSDVGALRTRVTSLEDGRWSITGTKIFISFGDHDLAENMPRRGRPYP